MTNSKFILAAKAAAAAAALGLTSIAAQAAPVTPVAYAMLNGGSGSFTYHDDSYDGAGSVTTDYATLSGGVGDLTDGVIATQNWHVTPGPYVGWAQLNPVITFDFGAEVALNAVTLFFDDSNGAGGVSSPASFSFGLAGGPQTPRGISDGPSGAPSFATLFLSHPSHMVVGC